jgi:hypothetical protein
MPVQRVEIPQIIVKDGPGGQVVISGVQGNPVQIYQGFREKRNVLGNQLEDLEDRRENLVQELQQTPAGDNVVRKGLEQRITEVDARISVVEKQIAEADVEVATAAAVPGAAVRQPPPPRPGPPEEVWMLAGMFIFAVLLPLSIGYARRLWKRAATVVSAIPGEVTDRLTRIEQAVDAIAIEIERIGEGQRYVNQAMRDGSARALGMGAAEPLEVRQREREEAERFRR